jgi:CheY-like chemotaxis protein
MSNSGLHFQHVLLIDDSEIDVLVNRRLIQLTNFASAVTVTSSGEEALHFLREECTSAKDAPDWIFLDMHLPMMSGYDFIEEFKALPSFITGKSRIIILSVFQKQEMLIKAFENKFVAGQFEKPLTQQALLDIVAN